MIGGKSQLRYEDGREEFYGPHNVQYMADFSYGQSPQVLNSNMCLIQTCIANFIVLVGLKEERKDPHIYKSQN